MLTNYDYPFNVYFLMDVQPEVPNGKTVVLLHGKNFNGAYWKATIDALTKEGYRVVVPDQIGFGKSSKPMGYHHHRPKLSE